MFRMPGKPITIDTASLDITISAGVVIDYSTWVSAKDHVAYFGTNLPSHHNGLGLSILLDGAVLFDGAVGTESVTIHHDFEDSKINCAHVLEIVFSGLGEDCNHLLHGKETFSMFRIDSIAIENLPMQFVLENLGKYYHDDKISVASKYIGFNGRCVLEFQTPIYQWLLSNDSLIKVIPDAVNNFDPSNQQ